MNVYVLCFCTMLPKPFKNYRFALNGMFKICYT